MRVRAARTGVSISILRRAIAIRRTGSVGFHLAIIQIHLLRAEFQALRADGKVGARRGGIQLVQIGRDGNSHRVSTRMGSSVMIGTVCRNGSGRAGKGGVGAAGRGRYRNAKRITRIAAADGQGLTLRGALIGTRPIFVRKGGGKLRLADVPMQHRQSVIRPSVVGVIHDICRGFIIGGRSGLGHVCGVSARHGKSNTHRLIHRIGAPLRHRRNGVILGGAGVAHDGGSLVPSVASVLRGGKRAAGIIGTRVSPTQHR